MKGTTTILATIALGAMLATGSATASMARGGGGGGEGHGGGAHATGSASGAQARGAQARGQTDPSADPDMYGDYFCESPYPHNRFYGHDSIHHPCR